MPIRGVLIGSAADSVLRVWDAFVLGVPVVLFYDSMGFIYYY